MRFQGIGNSQIAGVTFTDDHNIRLGLQNILNIVHINGMAADSPPVRYNRVINDFDIGMVGLTIDCHRAEGKFIYHIHHLFLRI